MVEANEWQLTLKEGQQYHLICNPHLFGQVVRGHFNWMKCFS